MTAYDEIVEDSRERGKGMTLEMTDVMEITAKCLLPPPGAELEWRWRLLQASGMEYGVYPTYDQAMKALRESKYTKMMVEEWWREKNGKGIGEKWTFKRFEKWEKKTGQQTALVFE